MVAIYARQSIDKKDSISIETQINFCKRELADNQDYRVFQDKGFSGKNTSRPAFKEMLEAIKNGNIEKIIVYRLDRISRSITDFANIFDLLEEQKVDFVSANEKFDTSTPVGKAMLYIIMVFAQLERETIAERIKDNYYSRGKNGVWLGGPPPLGFNNIKKSHFGKTVALLEPNQDVAIVQTIFKKYANSNCSLGSLAKELLLEHGGMWNNIKLARILHNPAYVKADADIYHFYQFKKCILVNDIDDFDGKKGCSLYGKRDRGANKYNALEEQVLAIALHEGIVDSQTWLRCQDKLSNNRQIKNTGKGKHSWLSGLIKCGYCGYSMNVKVYNQYKYLVCTGRFSTGNCIDKLATHYLEDIESYVFQEMCSFVENIDVEQVNAPKDSLSDKNGLKIELHKLESEIEKLLDTLDASNPVLMKYINEKIVSLDAKKSAILEELNTCTVSTYKLDIPDLSNWSESSLEIKKDAAQRLISKVLLLNDKIEVVWKA